MLIILDFNFDVYLQFWNNSIEIFHSNENSILWLYILLLLFYENLHRSTWEKLEILGKHFRNIFIGLFLYAIYVYIFPKYKLQTRFLVHIYYFLYICSIDSGPMPSNSKLFDIYAQNFRGPECTRLSWSNSFIVCLTYGVFLHGITNGILFLVRSLNTCAE